MLKPLTNLSMMERNHMNAQNVTQEHMYGIQQRKYLCSKCGKFVSRSTGDSGFFLNHIDIKQQGVNSYDCSDCSVEFLLETALKIHISTVHGNNVGSICPICGRVLKLPMC